MELSYKEKIRILFIEAFIPLLFYHGIFFFTVTKLANKTESNEKENILVS